MLASTMKGDLQNHCEMLCSKLQGAIYLSNSVSEFFYLPRKAHQIRVRACKLNFLYLVTKNMGKNVYLHSS